MLEKLETKPLDDAPLTLIALSTAVLFLPASVNLFFCTIFSIRTT
jgi:hypothetical protein